MNSLAYDKRRKANSDIIMPSEQYVCQNIFRARKIELDGKVEIANNKKGLCMITAGTELALKVPRVRLQGTLHNGKLDDTPCRQRRQSYHAACAYEC